MSIYYDVMKLKRQRIIDACKNGDYVLATEDTENVLCGYFFLSLLFKSMDHRLKVIAEKRKMMDEFNALKARYPGLIVKKIPEHAVIFRQSPRYPSLLCPSPHYSGFSSLLQLLYVIHPVRNAYLHCRWIDGVPQLDENTSVVETQVTYFHECISVLFDRMHRFCSKPPDFVSPHKGIQEHYEKILVSITDVTNFKHIDPNIFLSRLLNSITDQSIHKHPAFVRFYNEALLTKYADYEGNIHICHFVQLEIDVFTKDIFHLHEILFSHSFDSVTHGVQTYLYFSNYLLFTLNYNVSRVHNMCILDEVLEITNTNEVFDLLGAVYTYWNSKGKLQFRTLVNYNNHWYLINNKRIMLFDFQSSKDNIFFNDTLQTVLYKKRPRLSLIK